MKSGLVTNHGNEVALLGVHIEAELLGAHTRVTVTQRYKNSEAAPIEAIYTFPLTSNATLMGFTMTVNGRKLEGRVMERDEAFKTYDNALYEGHGAALLDQERPNVFTANVGNLLPGEDVLICVTYIERANADEGRLSLRISTLVAPRYIPGAPDFSIQQSGHGTASPTAQVPDADRISPPIGDARYGVTFRLSVPRCGPSSAYRSGGSIVVESPSHPLSVASEADRIVATFAVAHVSLDRDIVINVRQDENLAFASVDAHRRAGEEGTVALSFVPRFSLEQGENRKPQRVVFLVDTSGSMEGLSIDQAKTALKLCLRQLTDGDQFTVIAFESEWRAMGSVKTGGMLDRVIAAAKGENRSPRLFPYTQDTLSKADAFIDELCADGGTELLSPLVAATRLAPDGVIVLLTDGQVGNEEEIATNVFQVSKGARFYTFGIGTNVSDALLRDLAVRSGGALSFIYPGEALHEKVVGQFSRAFAERVTDVKVESIGVDLVMRAPAEPRDIVEGDAWTMFARYAKAGEGRVKITGKRSSNGSTFAIELPVHIPETAESPFVEKLWAKEQISELESASHVEKMDRRTMSREKRIVELAVKHQIGCRQVSFVVVEEREGDRRVSGTAQTRVIPVSTPFGWSMFDPQTSLGSSQSFGSAPAPDGFAPSMAAAPSQRASSAGGGDPRSAAPKRAMKMDRMRMAAPSAMAPRILHRDSESQDDGFHAIGEGSALPELQAEPWTVLLGQQASGLWAGATDDERIRATVIALLVLKKNEIDGGHPVYGAQIRKAIAAIVALSEKVASTSRDVARCGLSVAWLMSEGHKRTEVEMRAKATMNLVLVSEAIVTADIHVLSRAGV